MAAAPAQSVSNLIEQQVLKAAQIIEERLDDQIRQFDDLNSDDIEKLREKRLLQLKKEAKTRQENLAKVNVESFLVELLTRSSLLVCIVFSCTTGTRRIRRTGRRKTVFRGHEKVVKRRRTLLPRVYASL